MKPQRPPKTIEVHNPKGVFLTDGDVKIFLAEVRKYKEKMDANSRKKLPE
jgi:hypothetical protein